MIFLKGQCAIFNYIYNRLSFGRHMQKKIPNFEYPVNFEKEVSPSNYIRVIFSM